MRRIVTVVAVAAAVAATGGRGAAAGAELRLAKVTVQLPAPGRAVLVLEGPVAPVAGAGGISGQRLTAGDVEIPVRGDVALVPGDPLRVTCEVPLAGVPEAILSLDPNRVPLRWEGLDRNGRAVLALAGTVDFGDPGEVALPVRTIYRDYARLGDVSLVPHGATLQVRALLGLVNPFSFDIVATGLDYRITVGSQDVAEAHRPGFRLRAGQRSDVLLEQEVSVIDAASAMAAFLQRQPAVLEGKLVLRTPRGEHAIPLLLRAGL